MIKVITIAAMVAATFVTSSVPAVAQVREVCLTQTIFGEKIAPMCFVPESIGSMKSGVCEVVLVPSGGTRCVFDRPAPPRPN
jgi:hypothetical protein